MNAPTLSDLAKRVGGEIVGDASRAISGAAGFDRALPDQITFAADEKLLKRLPECRAGACLVERRHLGHKALDLAAPALVFVDDPLAAIMIIAQIFRPPLPRAVVGLSAAAVIAPGATVGPGTNVYPGAFIDEGAVIGSRCDLYPGVYVGRACRVGDDCVLHPHVVLYANVRLRDRVIVHAGAVLGADGFGYRFARGRYEKIPQVGWVDVGDDCEIGACTTIDRGTLGPTIIAAGTKLDNLVMIGHNCEVGPHNAFASQVGLAGSVTTGAYVRCAGQVGVADHVHLGQGSTVGAKSGVHKDVPEGATYVGYPARPEEEQFKIVMASMKTPEMRKQIRELEARLEALERQLAQGELAAAEARSIRSTNGLERANQKAL